MKLLLLSLTLFVSSFTFSQNEIFSYVKLVDGVEFLTRVEQCNNPSNGTNKEYVFIQIRNTNSYSVKLSFSKATNYGNGMTSKSENSISLDLNAQEILTTNCDEPSKDLKIFSKMIDLKNVRKLIEFDLKNITVEKK